MNILNRFNEPKLSQTQANIEKRETIDIDKSRKNADTVVISQKDEKPKYKPDILDKLSEKVVNKRDLNDMVTTPRAIFKGYMCFIAGTTINSIAQIIKTEKNTKLIKGLNVLGALVSLAGTYNFVKPFLIKNKE